MCWLWQHRTGTAHCERSDFEVAAVPKGHQALTQYAPKLNEELIGLPTETAGKFDVNILRGRGDKIVDAFGRLGPDVEHGERSRAAVVGVGAYVDRAAVSVHVLLGGVGDNHFHGQSVRRRVAISLGLKGVVVQVASATMLKSLCDEPGRGD